MKISNFKFQIKEGLWNIYKPKGVSSFDVVQRIKRMTGEKKVGHAGTLDPLAEGVLIVGVGRESTKKLRFVLEEDKEYIGEIKLGMVSTTDDEEGIKSKVASRVRPLESHFAKATRDKFHDSGTRGRAFPSDRAIRAGNERVYNQKWPSREEIEQVIEDNFIGDVMQVTPTYSAVKIRGERAYKKVRRGEEFTRPPRIVTIKEIEILDYRLKTFKEIKQPDSSIVPAGEYPILKIRCVVGSGTYIRSLSREIGEKLGTGGYLTSLIRTRIGSYKIENSVKL